MSADQYFTSIRCACPYCTGQGETAQGEMAQQAEAAQHAETMPEALRAWARSYYVPDPPKIPDPPGSSTTTGPAVEPGWSGPGFLTLLRGDDWNDPEVGIPTVVPYTFATRAMSKYALDDTTKAGEGFQGTSGELLDAAQRANIRLALSMWEQVSGLTFVEVADSPKWNYSAIRFSLESIEYQIDGDGVFDFAAYARPTSGVYGSNIVLNRLHYADDPLQPGTFGFLTAMHEIGHAIGLKHPFQDGLVLQESRDNTNNTVMSYTDKHNYTHLGPFDIDAVRHLYGTPEMKAAAAVQWAQGPRGSLVSTANDEANVIVGIEARDVVRAGGGGDLIATGDGDDWVSAGTGDDAVFGEAGIDTLYTGTLRGLAAVELGVGKDGSVQGTVKSSEGMDSFYSVENLGFVDGILAISNDTVAAQVYRLYDTAFNHKPDPIGLGFWTEAVEAGATSLAVAATQFANSPEFVLKYGALSDSAFVFQLYMNVLDRAPDGLGQAAWVRALASGSSRGDVLVGFSESVEHRKTTAEAFAKGVWAVDPDAVDVMRGYMTVLDRKPDVGGLTNWTNAHEAGLSQPDFIARLVSSDEFQARFGGLSNRDFVEQMYRTALDRPADAEGLAAWTHILDAGIDNRAGVALGFSNSFEMTAKLTPMAESSILFA